ncbi:MAG: tetratricopeptide repeat protein, partial [Myxococcota bacterium]|nr:tetratricopeptide repeat protein [Myxococcota bacterium]
MIETYIAEILAQLSSSDRKSVQELLYKIRTEEEHQQRFLNMNGDRLMTLGNQSTGQAPPSAEHQIEQFHTISPAPQEVQTLLPELAERHTIAPPQTEGTAPQSLEGLSENTTTDRVDDESRQPELSRLNTITEEEATLPPVLEAMNTVDKAPHSPKETQHETIEAHESTRYIDLGLLGKGGMGEVRKVQDNVLKRTLAMKIIHPKLLENNHALTRFIEEAQVGAQLQHPNILPVHELGKLPDGRYYFTMKEVKGTEFTQWIHDVHKASEEHRWLASEDGISFRRLIQIFHTICETMAFAHSLGVLHRDLKPDNVMIGDFGEVLIVDWGIAKVMGQTESFHENVVQTDRSQTANRQTQLGSVSGTPSYMSPEQAKGLINQLSPSSDIYTLGAILYEILSGSPPFSGHSPGEILFKVRHTSPPSLFGTNHSALQMTSNSLSKKIPTPLARISKIPSPLIRICEKAMERKIEDRYSSADALAKDIFDWLEGAQKRDKALKEVEKAKAVMEQAQKLLTEANNLWKKTKGLFEGYGFENEAAWSLWSDAQRAFQEGQRKQREYERILQGALVYDAQLEEAHERLSDCIIESLLKAIAMGNKERRDILLAQFEGHIKKLSPAQQQERNQRLREYSNDKIYLLRARRGPLVGRTAQSLQIRRYLKEEGRLVSLVGTAGVGKTRLALDIIHDIREERQAYFCDLTEATTVLGVVRLVAKDMDIQLGAQNPLQQLGEYFDKNPSILVLDNLEQVVGPVGEAITQWLSASETLKLIATSRVRLQLPIEKSFAIQPLGLLEAMELFTKRAQIAKSTFELGKQNRFIVGRIVEKLDKLPLAIELAAARMNIFNVGEIETRLNERFSLLRSRKEGIQALSTALDWSWDLLKPWHKAAFTQSSIFHGGFDIDAAENIIQIGARSDSPAIFDILQDLCEDSLLRQESAIDGSIRYGMLESIRQYAKNKLMEHEGLEVHLSRTTEFPITKTRHSQYYARYGQKTFLNRLDSSDGSRHWLELFAELDNLVAATMHGEGEDASLCCIAALKVLGMKGPLSLGVDVASSVLSSKEIPKHHQMQIKLIRTKFLRISGRMKEARGHKESKEAAPSHDTETTPLPPPNQDLSITQPATSTETPEERHMRAEEPLEAKETAKELTKSLNAKPHSVLHSRIIDTETKQKGASLSNEPSTEIPKRVYTEEEELRLLKAHEFVELGNIEEAESIYDKALAYYHQAAAFYQNASDPKGHVRTLEKIAIVLKNQGEYQQSLEALHSALEIIENHELHWFKANLYSVVGDIHRYQGEYQRSLEFHNRALKINQTVGNKLEQGTNHGNIGVVYQNLGQDDKAIEYYQKAIAIAREIGNKRSEGLYLGKLGNMHLNLNRSDEAIRYYKQGIDIAHEIGDKRTEGINTGNLGIAYDHIARYDKALECYQRSRAIAREIGNKRSEGSNLSNIGTVYRNLGQDDKAIEHYQKAIAIAREIGNRRSEGIALGNLGVSYGNLKQYDKAVEYFQRSISVSREIGNKRSEGIYLGYLGEVYHQLNRNREAKDHLKKAIQICGDLKINSSFNFYGELALIFAEENNRDEAMSLLTTG